MRTTICAVAAILTIGRGTSAQIPTDIVERSRGDLQKQASSAEMKREGGTQPQDWAYTLPDGVATRQVTFYVDGGFPLYGKLFLPRGFDAHTGRWPAVVVGHGINAISIGIEKYAARFADRGLVAMAIDYRSYGFSGSEVSLLDTDTTTDERSVWEREARVQLKRTDLNNFHEVDDFRAALSFLQGEPGIDADRIGIWGSSNGGSVVIMVAEQDPRVKAVVSQVAGVGNRPATGPAAIPPAALADSIQRARTGKGAEVDGGFSFRTKIDLWSNQVNREFRPGSMIDRIPETTRILSIIAEHDELIPAAGAPDAAKAFRGTWQVVVVPSMTHFQMYSGTAFEVGSMLAADWFLKYLK
ncbi:MAG TPA: prolyl oligopeptidase family serine peptidase [Vicinamibacterales bacterium]